MRMENQPAQAELPRNGLQFADQPVTEACSPMFPDHGNACNLTDTVVQFKQSGRRNCIIAVHRKHVVCIFVFGETGLARNTLLIRKYGQLYANGIRVLICRLRADDGQHDPVRQPAVRLFFRE